ncbi:MAG TPA: ATP-binding protein, partial [Myxococcales bacterium]
MTIHRKLLLAFFGLLLTATLLGAALIALAVDNVRRVEQIVSVYDVLQLDSLKLRFDLMVMSDAMRGFMLNPRDASEHERKLGADHDFSSDVAQIKAIAPPEMTGRILAAERMDVDILDRLEEQIMDLAGKGEGDQAKELYLRDYLPRRALQVELINGVESAADEQKTAALAKVSRATQVAVWSAIVLVALLGIGGAIAAQAVTRNLVGPLADTARLATAAAGGDLSVHLEHDARRDEIGEMSRAFNRFLEFLRDNVRVANAIASEDLSAEVRPRSPSDAFGHALERMVTSLRESDRKLRAELAARHRAAEELRVAKEAAEAGTKAKSEFLANMSHEIRTPLNGIIGMTELALGDDLSRAQQQRLRIVKSSAESLLALLNDVLDFSKIETRKLEIEQRPFALRELLRDAVAPFAARAAAKRLEFTLDVDDDVPATVAGDAVRLRQIVVNLVGNAIKFTDKGWVRVHVRQGAHVDGHAMLHVVVADSGIGIPPEKQSVVFEPFSQADASITRRYGGSGLGLAICSTLVRMMGGRIWVESTPGAGSTFSFTVSLDTAAAQTVADVAPADAVRHGRPVSVLLVEDNVVNQQVAAGLLMRRGHTVTTVDSGADAVAACAAHRFDVVLMDVQMPGMDGFEATAAIRANESVHGGHVRIIAMTAHAMTGDRERCLAAGMDAYVPKPVDPRALFASVEASADASPAAASVSSAAPRDVLVLDRDDAIRRLA